MSKGYITQRLGLYNGISDSRSNSNYRILYNTMDCIGQGKDQEKETGRIRN